MATEAEIRLQTQFDKPVEAKQHGEQVIRKLEQQIEAMRAVAEEQRRSLDRAFEFFADLVTRLARRDD